jgi:hypothetical protein
MIAQYDISKLTELVSGLNGALIGQGASAGDGTRLIQTETGQLAGRIGDSVGPKTLASATKIIDREIKGQLTILPRFSIFDSREQSESSKYSGFSWLTAGPGFLTGINDEDNQKQAGGVQAYEMFRAGQHSAPRGKSYVKLGSRGSQAIQRLNRVRVSASSFNYVRNRIRSTTGEMRAAFYSVAKHYVPSKRVAGWIMERMPAAVAKGKTEHRDSGNVASPQAFTEFVVRSPGLNSNDRLQHKIQGAIEYSRISLANKLKKIVRGYKYNWQTGAVYPASQQSFAE